MLIYRWRLVVFLFMAGGLNYGDRAALSAVIPPLRSDIGVTDAQIGFAGMLFLWCYALCSPLAGNLADRFSRPRIITWSLTVWSLIMALTGFVQGAMQLYTARIALGIAESLYLPAAGALLGDHHDWSTRGKAMGLHLLGLNVGLVIGGSAAGFIAEHLGWRYGFWLLGGGGLLLAAVSPFFLKEPTSERRKQRAVLVPSQAKAAWGYLLRVPSFHCLLFSAMVSGVASWSFFSWLPLFFTENYGMKLGAAGFTSVALFNGPLFVGIAVGGWLSDKLVQRDAYSRALLKGLSFVVSAPLLCVFIWAPSFPVVAMILAASSGIRALGMATEHPLVCEVIPSKYRSTAIGIMNTCGAGAGGVGVLLAGLFKEHLGLNVIFGASSFLYLLAGLPMLWCYRYAMRKDAARATDAEAEHPPAKVGAT